MRVLETERCADFDIVSKRVVMDRRQPLGHAAASGSRRLRIDGGDLMAGLDEARKRGHGEVRRAHEDEAQAQVSLR